MFGVSVDMLADVMFVDRMTDVMFRVGGDMLTDMEIIVTPEITLKFFGGVEYVADVLIIDVVSAIDVAMLADENASGLAAAMTPSEFTLSAPTGESKSFR